MTDKDSLKEYPELYDRRAKQDRRKSERRTSQIRIEFSDRRSGFERRQQNRRLNDNG